MSLVGQASAASTFGATVSVSTSVMAGQSYYFKVLAASSAGGVGGYGLLVNFGSQTQSPIPPPNTVVASQPDQGGGMGQVTLGDLTGYGVEFTDRHRGPEWPRSRSGQSDSRRGFQWFFGNFERIDEGRCDCTAFNNCQLDHRFNLDTEQHRDRRYRAHASRAPSDRRSRRELAFKGAFQ